MEYLAFANRIEDNVYSLYFTDDTDTVWGNQWNVCPSGIIPGITVDEKCITSSFLINCDFELNIACENTCFSMQDCIDQIIPMIWSNPWPKISLVSHFGEEKDKVIEKLNKCSITPYNDTVFESEADKIMNNMMSDLDSIGKKDDDIDEF